MSHDRDGKEVYGRERQREIYLQVPNYSNSGRRSHSPTEVSVESGSPRLDRNMIDDVVDEIYNLSDHSETPLSPSNQFEEKYSIPPISKASKGYQRENQYQEPSYHSPSSNAHTDLDTSSFGLQHPPDMQPRHHTSRPQSASSNHTKVSGNDKNATGKKMPTQIEEYKKKAFLLRQELTMLRNQRNELRGSGKRSPSPDTRRFLKENTKLQLDIQSKLITINNVLDMVGDIMGEHYTVPRKPSSPERKPKQKWSQKFNYIFYDPELHWCRVCNVFPQTAKDYLNHLHSKDHQMMAAEHEEFPWHNVAVDSGYPTLPEAPTKRTPVRGLQFFVPAVAWYCKLCDQFIGDLHCASIHIKSIAHSKNYNKFVQQNPHWETDWVSDRQRAYEQKTQHDVRENKETCSVQYVTKTLTISKDVHTKRSPQGLELEARNRAQHEFERNSGGYGTRSTLGDVSIGESTEETRIRNKRFKHLDVDPINMHRYDSPSTSEARLSDDNTPLPDRTTRCNVRDGQDPNRSDSRLLVRAQRGRSNERRERSRDRNNRSRDSNNRSRDRNNRSRDRSERSRDNMTSSRDRKGSTSDTSGSSCDRSGSYRDRRGSSRDRGGSRDKDGSNQDTRGSSRDKKILEPMDHVPSTTPALPTPLPLGSGTLPPPSRYMPKPTAPPARKPSVPALPSMATLPPIIMPPPPFLLPPGTIPDVPKEFIEQLELIFPTDPTKCAEMLNSMQEQQQPSLLGPPPGLSLPFPLDMMNPGMFPFDYTAAASMAALFPTPPVVPLIQENQNSKNQGKNANNQSRNKPQSSNSSNNKRNQQTSASDRKGTSDVNDLIMLGIDETDVSAKI